MIVSDEIAIFRLELAQREDQLDKLSKNMKDLKAENSQLVETIVQIKEEQV
jgi:septal ring factor EnvC (AmiA/AmiB activator)